MRNEATIVLGQRKLLQRLVPGLVHAFIFWGFLVLFPTIVHGAASARSTATATLPRGSAHQGWFALLVDVFCVARARAASPSAFWIRKVQRPARFEGSHLGEADLILGADRADRDDAALLARVADRARAERVAGGLVAGLERDLARSFGDGDVAEVRERIFVWAHVLPILGFLAYLPHSKHLHIATAGDQRLVRAHAGAAAGSSRSTSRSRTRRELRLRRRDGRRHDLEADARHDVLHGVRPLPGRLPCLCDRARSSRRSS